MSVRLFDAALSERPGAVAVRLRGASPVPLPVARWRGEADAADLALLARTAGPTLDIGCGPGRLAAALQRRGVPALGIDIAPGAVRLARARGGVALQRSVFAPVPGEGRWAHALLADGNIGIGGDPVALLARSRELIGPDGRVHVELGAPGSRTGRVLARLEPAAGRPGAAGPWFPWALLTVDDVAAAAAASGLAVVEVWDGGDRWFAELRGPLVGPTAAPADLAA